MSILHESKIRQSAKLLWITKPICDLKELKFTKMKKEGARIGMMQGL